MLYGNILNEIFAATCPTKKNGTVSLFILDLHCITLYIVVRRHGDFVDKNYETLYADFANYENYESKQKADAFLQSVAS